MIIELEFGGIIYGATLTGCYDGDTCRANLHNSPAIVSNLYIRIHGVDTPEIRGKCEAEKSLARDARDFTIRFIRDRNSRGFVHSLRDKYGRMVVEFPGLADDLVKAGLGRYYDGGKRKGWCND